MFYGNKSIKELDDYYNIKADIHREFPYWMESDCKKIQSGFNNHGIQLTLAECKEIYATYSDESFCSGWNAFIEDCSEESLFNLLQPWLKTLIHDKINRICTLTKQLEQGGYLKKQEDDV